MTGVHDMGGRTGDGPVTPEPQGTVPYGADWQAKALALTLAAGGLGAWSIDASRHARESLAPEDYNRFGYYEKWIAALADLLVARDLVTRDELAAGRADPAPPHPRLFTADRVPAALARGTPYARPDGPAPAFAAGDRVRTIGPPGNRLVPGGHTRLPAYAAGKTGRILLSHGPHVLPDANAHGLGERPEPLYTVVFAAADLWDAAEAAGDEVTLDLWESYLERT